MGQHHRYARPEVERRFLLATVPAGLPVGRLLVDRYLPGTRLRLREVREAGGEVTRKLGQRVREGTGPGRVWHTSVLLDEAEWALLSGLGGHPLVKARHTVWLDDDDLTVAVDVLAGRHTGTVLAEVDLHGRDRAEEADLTSALAAAGLDVVREVTREEDYTGGGLAAGATAGTWEVTAYWRPGCGFCALLRDRLAAYGERVRWVDIWREEAGACFVRAANRGDETVPTVVVGADVWTNPEPARVTERLDRGSR